jgi:hypothetical protein
VSVLWGITGMTTNRRMWPTPQISYDGRSQEAWERAKASKAAKHRAGGYAKGTGAPGMMDLQRAVTMDDAEPVSNQSTLFAEAFPVSRIRPLDDAWAVPTSATSGRSSPDSFASVNPDGSWRKTSQGYSQVTLDGSLARFSETWPRAGMTRNGTAYRLRPSAPLTAVTASGSWPTPDARDSQPEGYEAGLRRKAKYSTWGLQTAVMWPTPCAEDAKNVPYQKGKDGVTRYPMLLGAVAPERMWPTPTSRDWKEALEAVNPDGSSRDRTELLPGAVYAVERQMWPTPNVPNGGRKPKGGMSRTGMTPDGKKRQVGLENAVTMWRSPQASDYKNRGSSEYREGRQIQLQTQVSGSLNPTWVEWLMGYPLGWTACAASATPSSRKSRSGSHAVSSPPKDAR